jgi:hypothetical protein
MVIIIYQNLAIEIIETDTKKNEEYGLQTPEMSCTFSADDTHDPTTNDEFRNAHGRCSGKERKLTNKTVRYFPEHV